jgi:hypothetical protein
MARRIHPAHEPKISSKESIIPNSQDNSLNITRTEHLKNMRVDVFRKTVANDTIKT